MYSHDFLKYIYVTNTVLGYLVIEIQQGLPCNDKESYLEILD